MSISLNQTWSFIVCLYCMSKSRTTMLKPRCWPLASSSNKTFLQNRDLGVLSSCFPTWPKTSGQKFKYLKNEKLLR